MKRTIKGLLAVAGLAFIGLGSLLAASPATAAVTITNITNNGITCKRHDGGTFPEDGHFYDCTSANPVYSTRALQQVGFIRGAASYPKVYPGLQNLPKTSIYVFENVVEYEQWIHPAGTCCTTAQKQTYFNQYGSTPGFTDNWSGVNPVTVKVFASFGDGPYPTRTFFTEAQFKNVLSHELGHAFDLLSTTTRPSNGLTPFMIKDKAWMFGGNPPRDPNATADYNDGSYWLGDKYELFAEIFALSYIAAKPVDTTISLYWACSRTYAQLWMKKGVAPVQADFPLSLRGSRCF